MSIIINSNFENDEKNYYSNVTREYSKFFVDNYYTPTLTIDQYSNWTSIAVNDNNGYMIGIGSNSSGTTTHNVIYSSDGGLNWSSQLISSSGTSMTQWNDIAFDGSSTYVAVGKYTENRNYILIFNESLTSIQGIQNGANGADMNTWNSITYGAGLFIAVSQDGNNRVMSSSNGINWTSKYIPLQIWKKIIYGKGIFIAASSNGDKKLIYSKNNGGTWSFCNIDIFSSDISNKSIIFCSKINKFIFSFYYATTSKNYIYYSNDGINWTKSLENDSSTNIIKSTTWSQELELIVVVLNSSSTYNLMFSRDGINWFFKRTNFGFNNLEIKIIWNRFFSNFIIITNKKSSGAIITTKNFGVNNFLEKNKYYHNDFFTEFYYEDNYVNNNSFNYFSIIPTVNIINENIRYSINKDLPIGVTLNSYNGVISGSYNDFVYFPKTEYIITANDLINNQKIKTKIFLQFIPNVDLYPLSIFFYNNNQTLILTINDNSVQINPIIFGSAKITYEINNNPNISIFSINNNTGVISINPILVGNFNLNVIATNTKNSLTTIFNIVIKNEVPGSFSYNDGLDKTITVNKTSQTFSPSTNVGSGIIYSVSSNISSLPGSSINSSTGILTINTPSSPVNVLLTITALNERGFSSTDFRIIVKNEEITIFKYNSNVSPFTLNDLINSSNSYIYTPNFQTGTNISYSIISSPSTLPNQFTFNTNNGIISGTPKEPSNSTYVIRAYNDISHQDYTFNFNFYYISTTMTVSTTSPPYINKVPLYDDSALRASMLGFASQNSGLWEDNVQYNFGSIVNNTFNGGIKIVALYYGELKYADSGQLYRSTIFLKLQGSENTGYAFNSITINNNYTIKIDDNNCTWQFISPLTVYQWSSIDSYPWFKNLLDTNISLVIR